MFWIATNYAYNPFTFNNLTVITHLLNGSSYFHAFFLVAESGMQASFDIVDLMKARDAGVFDQDYVRLPAVFGGEAVSFAKTWFPFMPGRMLARMP